MNTMLFFVWDMINISLKKSPLPSCGWSALWSYTVWVSFARWWSCSEARERPGNSCQPLTDRCSFRMCTSFQRYVFNTLTESEVLKSGTGFSRGWNHGPYADELFSCLGLVWKLAADLGNRSGRNSFTTRLVSYKWICPVVFLFSEH